VQKLLELLQQPLSMAAPPSPLSSRAKPRDLRFRGPFLGLFFDRRAPGSATLEIQSIQRIARRRQNILASIKHVRFHRIRYLAEMGMP
jgi:hypothetical protein